MALITCISSLAVGRELALGVAAPKFSSRRWATALSMEEALAESMGRMSRVRSPKRWTAFNGRETRVGRRCAGPV